MIVVVLGGGGVVEIKCQQSGRRARDDGRYGRNRARTYSALF